jgi:prevent-host-death family protein
VNPANQETRHVGLFDAKTHLSELISEAEQGKKIVITRRGQPVAQITAVTNEMNDRKEIVARMLRHAEEIQRRHPGELSREEATAWTREGRRYS